MDSHVGGQQLFLSTPSSDQDKMAESPPRYRSLSHMIIMVNTSHIYVLFEGSMSIWVVLFRLGGTRSRGTSSYEAGGSGACPESGEADSHPAPARGTDSGGPCAHDTGRFAKRWHSVPNSSKLVLYTEWCYAVFHALFFSPFLSSIFLQLLVSNIFCTYLCNI